METDFRIAAGAFVPSSVTAGPAWHAGSSVLDAMQIFLRRFRVSLRYQGDYYYWSPSPTRKMCLRTQGGVLSTSVFNWRVCCHHL
jgi:hypothetical protein